MKQQTAIVAAEPIPPLVPRPALLRPPADRFHFATVGPKAKVPIPQVGLAPLLVSHLTTEDARRPMHPMVQSPSQAVDPRLIVVRFESRQERRHLIRSTVPRGITSEEHVGRSGDQHPVAPNFDIRGERQPVEKGRRMVVLSVTRRVTQHSDRSTRLIGPVQALRVIVHLRDPETTIRSKIDGHRILHQWLAGHQLDAQLWVRDQTGQGRLR